MLDSCKMVQKQSEAFHTFLWHFFFSSLKQNFIAYRSSKVSDCIFEIHQLWQSGFSRVYSNSSSSCWFEPEVIKVGQSSSHNMYSNNIVNFQESTTILNAHTKKVWKLILCTLYVIIICICSLYRVNVILHIHYCNLWGVYVRNMVNIKRYSKQWWNGKHYINIISTLYQQMVRVFGDG